GAIDFTTIEVWTKQGLVTFYLLFAMEVATRRVHFVGCTTNPHGAWMKQIARNLTDSDDGFLLGTRYLLMDRDTKFCAAFRSLLEDSGVKPVRLPALSPGKKSSGAGQSSDYRGRRSRTNDWQGPMSRAAGPRAAILL
ncbi:hypothetical protein ACFL6M_07945, partial [Candidatus Eisenbacteria bacterium]